MIEHLRIVVSQAEQLSEQQQEAVAHALEEAIRDILDEQQWDELVSSPRSQQFLKRLIAEGRQEHAEGKTEEIKESL